MLGASKRVNVNVNHDAAQCAAVSRNGPKRVKEASSIMEPCAIVSTGQGSGPSGASESWAHKSEYVLFVMVSSTVRANVSTGHGAGPSSALESWAHKSEYVLFRLVFFPQ